jgi:prepilin-type N-terminal cleavage/methylation domain-containing protein
MNNKSSGFALIEVIISIVVLSAVLAGATGLIWSAATAVERNQDRLTATYLAQECMELARNARDSAWRQHLHWDCAFDEFPSPEKCVTLSIPLMEMKNAEGENLIPIFGEASKFSRKMTTIKNGEERAITCEVSWPRRSGTEYIFLDEILTNWRKT